jgi:hypothetical protein
MIDVKEIEAKTASGNEPAEEAKIIITITNGEFRALKEIKEKKKFRSIKTFLDFVLAIFVTPNTFIAKREDDGSTTKVTPAPDLVEPSSQ